MTSIITSTGTKGLLTWLKSAQPDLYAYLNPKIIAAAKQSKTQATMAGIMGCGPRNGGMGAMGYGSYASYATTTPSYTAGVQSLTTNITASAAPINDLNIAGASTDSATIANSTPLSSSLAATISSLANGYSNYTLTSAQISANNTLLQTNLARAQQGLPPLTAATAASGITSLTSNSGVLLLGVAALAAFMMMGKKSS